MSFIKEFKLLLKARYPILYIPTTEEERVEYVIRSCVQLYSNRGIYAWDFVDGYVGNPNDNGFASRNPLQALELIERLTPTNPAVFLTISPYTPLQQKKTETLKSILSHLN